MKIITKVLWISLFVGTTQAALAGPNSDAGTIIGGIAGGLIGNNVGHGSGRTVSTIGGAVIGSMVGNQVGRSADRSNHCDTVPCHYSSWESSHGPYPIRYRNTFIGPDGRVCRRAVLLDEYGDKVYATFCCYRTTPEGYCTRWVRVR